MSVLIYMEQKKQIVLGKIVTSPKLLLKEVGRWEAHNEVTRSSNGVWPAGFYKWSHYNAHTEEGYYPAAYNATFGGAGIHVFIVEGRTGMGIHAGRSIVPSKPGGKTLGCIRVPADAMISINNAHRDDNLSHILVARSMEEAVHDVVKNSKAMVTA